MSEHAKKQLLTKKEYNDGQIVYNIYTIPDEPLSVTHKACLIEVQPKGVTTIAASSDKTETSPKEKPAEST